MKKILIIDNYDSFVFNIVQMLREAKTTSGYDLVRNDRVDFTALDQYGGIILSPGPGIPSEAGELMRVVRECMHSHPMLGICLGHQAIAEACGARLIKLQHPLHGHPSFIRRTKHYDPLWNGRPEKQLVGRYHSWVVDPASLPPELLVTSLDESDNIMSLRHIKFPLYGVQFHPESAISDNGILLMNNWLQICSKYS